MTVAVVYEFEGATFDPPDGTNSAGYPPPNLFRSRDSKFIASELGVDRDWFSVYRRCSARSPFDPSGQSLT